MYCFYLGKELTYENVLEVLGAVDTEVFSRLMRSVIAGDVSASLHVLDEMVIQGRELGQFVTDFIWYMRNLLLVKTSDSIEDVIDASAERVQALKEEAQMVEAEVLMRYIRIFSELSGQIKYSSQKRVLIEIALIKLNKPMMEQDMSALIQRISMLEQKISEGMVVSENYVNQTKARTQSPDAVRQVSDGMPVEQPHFDRAIPADIQFVADNWGTVLQRISSPPVRLSLKEAMLSVRGDNTLLIVFDDRSMGYDVCSQQDVVEMLEAVIRGEFQKEMKVEVKKLEANQNFADSFQAVKKKINMDIVEEDF